jgi:PEP-CTERM motif
MKSLAGLAVFLAAFAGAALPASAATNLIVNGGFETGDFTGWTVGQCNGTLLMPYHITACGVGNGQYFNNIYGAQSVIDHSGQEAAHTLQTLSLRQSVTIGQAGLYEASFFMGADYPCVAGSYSVANAIGSGGLGIFVNGANIGFDDGPPASQSCATGPDGMQEYSGQFLAAAPGTYTIAFDFAAGPASPLLSIDDIWVEQAADQLGVPEPSTWAMMLVGFLGVGFMLRRSRRPGALASR